MKDLWIMIRIHADFVQKNYVDMEVHVECVCLVDQSR